MERLWCILQTKKKSKKKQISFLAPEEMIDFLNMRSKFAGSRSEYLRHLVLQDMFGGKSEFVTIKEREQQVDTMSEEDRLLHLNIQSELKEALRNGVLKKVDENGSESR